jgi:hypothetical protein
MQIGWHGRMTRHKIKVFSNILKKTVDESIGKIEKITVLYHGEKSVALFYLVGLYIYISIICMIL